MRVAMSRKAKVERAKSRPMRLCAGKTPAGVLSVVTTHGPFNDLSATLQPCSPALVALNPATPRHGFTAGSRHLSAELVGLLMVPHEASCGVSNLILSLHLEFLTNLNTNLFCSPT